MKKIAKLLCLVLVVVMAVGILAACSSDKKSGTTDKGSTSTTGTSGSSSSGSSSGSSSSTGDKAATEEEVDYAAKVDTYTLLAPLFGELPDLKDEVLYQMIREQFGINWDITWVSSSDYTTKFQTVLSSGDIPDVVVATSLLNSTLNQCIADGYFADLTDYLGDFSKYPNMLNNSTEGAWNYVKTADGTKIVGIPRNRAALEMVIYMRKDWMDKFGYKVEDIKTVWDWKDAIVKIAKGDPDGNGKDDTVGFAAFGYTLGDGYITDNMASAFGAYNGQKDEDGGLYYYELTDGWIDYIQFAHEMYKDGAVSKEFSVLSLSEANDMFTAGLAVSYCRTGTWAWGYEDNLKNNLGIADAEVIALPALKGTNGNTTAVQTTGVYGAYFLNSELSEYDLLKLLNFYEKTNVEEWHNYAFFGMEDRDYVIAADGSKETTQYGKDNIMRYQSLQQVIMTMANTELKLYSTGAPKEFNDKIKAAALTYLEPDANIRINHFRAINSESWATVWPKYKSKYEENTVKAIVGEMSIDEYRDYIHNLRSQPDMKQCWQEFAKHDALLFPDGY